MKQRFPSLIILCLVATFFVGCSTSYRVRVDALSTVEGPEPVGQTYELVSATPGVQEGDLFFKEVVRHLRPVLSGRNYYPVGEGKTADLQIAVNAYLSDPLTETESYNEPIFMETAARYRTIRVPVVNDKGNVVSYSYSTYWLPPRTHVAGWVDRNRQITVYDKILHLSARRILNEKEVSGEIWAIKIALRGESTDYRSALPYMLVAAAPYVGKRTAGEEVIIIREDSEEVQSYRAGLSDGR
ncbi:MAG: hypothetical protein ACO3ZW_02820 [Opitutales bacterium]|jgi:hypothetical protein